MVFMVSTVTRKRSIKKRCICTLLICTVWMVVEIIVSFVLETMSVESEIIADVGSFISKIYMLLFLFCLDVMPRKNSIPKFRSDTLL